MTVYNNNDLILKDSKHGKGVFAGRKFSCGEMILEFQGRLYTYEESAQLLDPMADRFLQIGENLYLGPPGGIDDFVNHSCNPNAGIIIAPVSQSVSQSVSQYIWSL